MYTQACSTCSTVQINLKRPPKYHCTNNKPAQGSKSRDGLSHVCKRAFIQFCAKHHIPWWQCRTTAFNKVYDNLETLIMMQNIAPKGQGLGDISRNYTHPFQLCTLEGVNIVAAWTLSTQGQWLWCWWWASNCSCIFGAMPENHYRGKVFWVIGATKAIKDERLLS